MLWSVFWRAVPVHSCSESDHTSITLLDGNHCIRCNLPYQCYPGSLPWSKIWLPLPYFRANFQDLFNSWELASIIFIFFSWKTAALGYRRAVTCSVRLMLICCHCCTDPPFPQNSSYHSFIYSNNKQHISCCLFSNTRQETVWIWSSFMAYLFAKFFVNTAINYFLK